MLSYATHSPKILREYAKCRRLKTQDGRYVAPSEVFQHEAWPQCTCQALSRSFGLLREPLLMLSCIHLVVSVIQVPRKYFSL